MLRENYRSLCHFAHVNGLKSILTRDSQKDAKASSTRDDKKVAVIFVILNFTIVLVVGDLLNNH